MHFTRAMLTFLKRSRLSHFMDFHAGSFRAARSLLGLGQADVSVRADVDRNVVFRVETGKYRRAFRPQAVKLRRYFERAGIEFAEATSEYGPGIFWDTEKLDVLVPRGHLRAGRALAGLLQADLASQAGVTQSLISRFASGKTQTIPTEEFDKITIALKKAGVVLLDEPKRHEAGVLLEQASERSSD
ncbi:helix-turn-helix domain-containing protein [Rhizobium leguminosarum]|uniref:helix-turn-helix domain-containing protein n=1 Tax=Rhizobium leguminosarum TaxID=384 RepID=UPI003D7C161E